ncbi:RICIN domain-containing protein [Longispora urticae]
MSSLVAPLTGAGQADADSVIVVDPARYNMYPREVDSRIAGSARAVIEGAEAKGVVQRVSALSVAQSAEHRGRSLTGCHDTPLNPLYKFNGFCWDSADDTTSAWSNGWHNQGFTGSHDADAGGTIDGHHLYMADWYKGDGPVRGVRGRVSILESTGTSWTYGHVLLVKPTGDRFNPGYTPVDDFHGDGMTWYGDRLYVANGGELQIYDLNHLWKVNNTEDVASVTPGIQGGVSRGYGHTWVLPMIARYSNRTKAQQDSAGNHSNQYCDGDIACLSALSLDRSGFSAPRLISARHAAYANAPVVTWSIDEFTEGGTATVTAKSAFLAPVIKMQGVATDGVNFYIAANCPTGYLAEYDDTVHPYSCIWQAMPGGGAEVLTRSQHVTQNLSYARGSGRLWGMSEYLGDRVVFSLRPQEDDGYQYLYNNFSKLCAGVGSKLDWSKPVKQWGCNNAQDERWLVQDTTDNNGNPAIFLRNVLSNQCMGADNSLANDTDIIQYPCNGAVDEKWWYNHITGTLRNVYSGKCLGLGADADKGSHLIQWTCNNAKDEVWILSPTAPNI